VDAKWQRTKQNIFVVFVFEKTKKRTQRKENLFVIFI
jgi:hypothetical protein